MIAWTNSSLLTDPGINSDADHLDADRLDALRYALNTVYMSRVELKAYACECKHCEITLYTSTKRLNCEYCGSSDPEVFTCTELK